MYPWYRDTQIGVGQYCGPVSASINSINSIKTETGYNSDCMLALDYAAVTAHQSKVSATTKTPFFAVWLVKYFYFSSIYQKNTFKMKKKVSKSLNEQFVTV